MHIGLISVVLSHSLGILSTSNNKVVRAILRVYLEVVRVMPRWCCSPCGVLFGTSEWFDVNFDGIEASIVVFTFWEQPSLVTWYEERTYLSMTACFVLLAFLASKRSLRSSYLRLSAAFLPQLST